MLETCLGIKKGDKLLVLTDTRAWPIRLGETLMHVAGSMGVEVVLAIINPLTIAGDKPPSSVARAMKGVNYVLQVAASVGVGHSEAAKEARDCSGGKACCSRYGCGIDTLWHGYYHELEGTKSPGLESPWASRGHPGL